MARTFVTKTAAGTTLASTMFMGSGAKQAVLTAYGVTSDLASSVMSIKSCQGVLCNIVAAETGAENATGQAKISVDDSTGFADDDIVIIQRADGGMERKIINTAGIETTGVHGITFTANLATAVTAGDKVFKMADIGSKAVGAASVAPTVSSGVYGFAAANPGSPLLVEIDGTSACSVDLATVAYV